MYLTKKVFILSVRFVTSMHSAFYTDRLLHGLFMFDPFNNSVMKRILTHAKVAQTAVNFNNRDWMLPGWRSCRLAVL